MAGTKKLQVKYHSYSVWRDVSNGEHLHEESPYHPSSDFHAHIRSALEDLWDGAIIEISHPVAPFKYRLVSIDE